MCYSGTCKNEIKSGPKRGECGGGRGCRCPNDYCVSCGDLTDDDAALCEYCKDTMNEYYDQIYLEEEF